MPADRLPPGDSRHAAVERQHVAAEDLDERTEPSARRQPGHDQDGRHESTGDQRGRSGLGGAAALIAGGLVAPVLVVAWLASRGGLGPFVEILGGYVLPLYGGVARVPWWKAIGWHRYGCCLLYT